MQEIHIILCLKTLWLLSLKVTNIIWTKCLYKAQFSRYGLVQEKPVLQCVDGWIMYSIGVWTTHTVANPGHRAYYWWPICQAYKVTPTCNWAWPYICDRPRSIHHLAIQLWRLYLSLCYSRSGIDYCKGHSSSWDLGEHTLVIHC